MENKLPPKLLITNDPDENPWIAICAVVEAELRFGWMIPSPVQLPLEGFPDPSVFHANGKTASELDAVKHKNPIVAAVPRNDNECMELVGGKLGGETTSSLPRGRIIVAPRDVKHFRPESQFPVGNDQLSGRSFPHSQRLRHAGMRESAEATG